MSTNNAGDGADFNSDAHARGRFPPHGRSQVRPDGQIFRVATQGPLNIEAIAAIDRTRDEVFANAPADGTYACINTFQRSTLISREALDAYEESLKESYLKGRYRAPAAMAWVFPPGIEGALLMRPLYEKVFAAVEIPFGIFATEQEAQDWVDTQLQAARRQP